MLTQDQRDNFRLTLASWNNYGATSVADLDIDDMIEDYQIVETRDTLEDFFNAQGRRLLKNGERPLAPFERSETLLGHIYVWENVQARKGARRGTLYVKDFGDVRAAYFDGEA